MRGEEPDLELVEQVRRRLAGLARGWTPMDVAHPFSIVAGWLQIKPYWRLLKSCDAPVLGLGDWILCW